MRETVPCEVAIPKEFAHQIKRAARRRRETFSQVLVEWARRGQAEEKKDQRLGLAALAKTDRGEAISGLAAARG